MLTPVILPDLNADPAAYVAWALQNPLLLARYPQKLAATRAAFEAGQYQGKRLHELALWLYETRARRRGQEPVVEKQKAMNAWLAFIEQRDTTDGRVFSQQERGSLRMQLMLAHGSELDWLGGPIAAEFGRRMNTHLVKVAALIADPPLLEPLPF